MRAKKQDIMPGVYIPWKGPMSMWSKRDVFSLTGNDHSSVYCATPIQASFSIWKANSFTREYADEWLDMASKRELISDDPSICGLPELPDFHDHRHDQSLLTICCLKHNIVGIDIGNEMPPIDTQHPTQISQMIDENSREKYSLVGILIKMLAWPFELLESTLRGKVSFGSPLPEPASKFSDFESNK
jgi:hypothetical protein